MLTHVDISPLSRPGIEGLQGPIGHREVGAEEALGNAGAYVVNTAPVYSLGFLGSVSSGLKRARLSAYILSSVSGVRLSGFLPRPSKWFIPEFEAVLRLRSPSAYKGELQGGIESYDH